MIFKNRLFEDVNYLHKKVLGILEKILFGKWNGNSIYYRLDSYGNKIKCSSDEDILKLFNRNIKIYEKIEDVLLIIIKFCKNLIQQ